MMRARWSYYDERVAVQAFVFVVQVCLTPCALV
jgi:hypothetical protein